MKTAGSLSDRSKSELANLAKSRGVRGWAGMDKPALIEPGRVYEYDLDLWNTCQLYRKGHRLRIEISSSAFPKYDRNLNTGAALGQTTEMQVAAQKIYHDREHLSYMILPIVPRKP